MYRRYPPNPGMGQPAMPQRTRSTQPAPKSPPVSKPKPPPMPKPEPPPPVKKPTKNPLWGWIPSSLYHPETKKILGLFSAEDLLLAGLIFLLLENEEKQDDLLIYALLYVLISDYLPAISTSSPPN